MSYEIFRINADSVVDFAALELKKYLRMMMPRCGEIPVSYAPDAMEGFRLGLMTDFGLDPEVENAALDDVVYYDCDACGGIIAGSNFRSVLLAVYRYLKSQGCNWLFPGPDGECIPLTEALVPVRVCHKASYRYRGQCNEGTETQPTMLDAIDFTPKVGLNIFMLEFDIPKYYYQRAYGHRYGNMPAEAELSDTTVLQWKRQCEVEIARRGLQFHDMGHGWTAEPFGFDSTEGWVCRNLPADCDVSHLAMINGVRTFFGGVALNTNLCMSNPETRSVVANYVADYAEKQNNVDFLHVWLADADNNHCECEACAAKTTSDWYVVLLNDIDAVLTARKLDTRIVFIAYVDTTWAPPRSGFSTKGGLPCFMPPSRGNIPKPTRWMRIPPNWFLIAAISLPCLRGWRKIWLILRNGKRCGRAIASVTNIIFGRLNIWISDRSFFPKLFTRIFSV